MMDLVEQFPDCHVEFCGGTHLQKSPGDIGIFCDCPTGGGYPARSSGGDTLLGVPYCCSTLEMRRNKVGGLPWCNNLVPVITARVFSTL